jgi:folylpolyglutamate synthase
MYTSPHMKTIRERIQIDSTPISQDLFTRYFFEVWEALTSSTCRHQSEFTEMPRYLQFLAVLSVHIFIKERVDAAIYETHNGGEYDATNIFSKPAVTGITTIGMDHVEQLGPSIQDISWHKAGIMKFGTPVFSSAQTPEVAAVLQQRAIDKGVQLSFVAVNPCLPLDVPNLRPEAQRVNCSLGLSLATSFLQTCAPRGSRDLDDYDIVQGVEHFSWLGRYHHIIKGTHHWFLDGAHNLMSIGKAGSWFAEEVAELPR